LNARPQDKPSVLVLVGPTASGKSAAALALAEITGAEIVNADSRQIYLHLDAATAKPSREDRSRVRHHLYDFLDPKRNYSAGDYRRDAEPVLNEILSRGKTPLIVGGTGLYLKSLFQGLSPLPPRDSSVREKLEREAETQGKAALHARLKSVDPVSAAKIPPGNLQRVIRALEVHAITGKPLSLIHSESPGTGMAVNSRFFGLQWDRAVLKERIRRRTEAMIPGLIEESRILKARGYGETDPGLEGIGYRDALRHLAGQISRDELLQSILKETAAYAKRQLTWFRADPAVRWIPLREPFDAEAAARTVLKLWEARD
jgi:tRNA dimethylallyltransferase